MGGEIEETYKSGFSLGSGIASEVELNIVLEEVRESNATQYWSVEPGGSILSSPAIYKDVVYFGCNDGILYALTVDGKLKWKFVAGDMIVSSPVVYNEKIFFGCYDGNMYCVGLDGNLVWNFNCGDKIAATPAIREGIIYFGSRNGFFYAIDENKKLLWKFQTGADIVSCPTLSENAVYAASNDGNLYALGLNGNFLWKFRTGEQIPGGILYHNGRVIFSSLDRHVYCLSEKGALLWKFRTPESVTGARGPIADGDIVYFGCRDNAMYAISILDGRLVWKYMTGNMVIGSYSVSGDCVYFGSTDYILYKADKRTGQLIWKYKTSGMLATNRPAIYSGKIFFGDWNGKFYCLSEKSGKIWDFQASSKPPSHIHVSPRDREHRRIIVPEDPTIDLKTDSGKKHPQTAVSYLKTGGDVYSLRDSPGGYITGEERGGLNPMIRYALDQKKKREH